MQATSSSASAPPRGRQLVRQQTLGGSVPPPLFEVSVTDRAFVPSTATVEPGRRIRYRVSADGSLNHILCVEGREEPSPLLRPGTSWILDTQGLPTGTAAVSDEVTCMRGSVVILEEVVISPTRRGGAGGGTEEETAQEEEEEEEEEGGGDDSEDDDGVDDAVIDNFLAALQKPAPRDEDDGEEEEEDGDWASHRKAFKATSPGRPTIGGRGGGASRAGMASSRTAAEGSGLVSVSKGPR